MMTADTTRTITEPSTPTDRPGGIERSQQYRSFWRRLEATLGAVTTPRPETKASTTIATTSVSKTATVSARRTRLTGVGTGGPGSSKPGPSMRTRYGTFAAHEVDAPM